MAPPDDATVGRRAILVNGRYAPYLERATRPLPAAAPQRLALLDATTSRSPTAARSCRSAPARAAAPPGDAPGHPARAGAARRRRRRLPRRARQGRRPRERPAINAPTARHRHRRRRQHHAVPGPRHQADQTAGVPVTAAARPPRSTVPSEGREDLDLRTRQATEHGSFWIDQRQEVRPEPGRPPGRAGRDRAVEAPQHQRHDPLRPPARGAVADRARATASGRRRGSAATRTPGGWTRARAWSWPPGSPTTPATS